jgi:hypothetical protein
MTKGMHNVDREMSSITQKRWNHIPETFTTGKTSNLLEEPILTQKSI